MKIQVKDKSHNEVIIVRRISWKERCEEQLSAIIKTLKNMKSNLEETKKSLGRVLGE